MEDIKDKTYILIRVSESTKSSNMGRREYLLCDFLMKIFTV